MSNFTTPFSWSEIRSSTPWDRESSSSSSNNKDSSSCILPRYSFHVLFRLTFHVSFFRVSGSIIVDADEDEIHVRIIVCVTGLLNWLDNWLITWVNFCWVCAAGLSEPLPHYSLFCGQSLTEKPKLGVKINVCNHRPHLSHFWATVIFAIPT